MNKVILVALLAVCVASSVQGYVKRDAPAAPAAEENYMEKIKEFSDQLGETFKKAFNPDEIKKHFDETVQTLSKGIEDMKKQMESKPEAAKP